MDKKIEELNNLIAKIKNSNTLIIVEGKKDKIALQKLGLGNIMELEKKPLFRIVEEVSNSNKECIILTDLDKKGKQIYGRLSHDLQARGIKINNEMRNFLFKKTKLRQVEGIDTYLEHLNP